MVASEIVEGQGSNRNAVSYAVVGDPCLFGFMGLWVNPPRFLGHWVFLFLDTGASQLVPPAAPTPPKRVVAFK